MSRARYPLSFLFVLVFSLWCCLPARGSAQRLSLRQNRILYQAQKARALGDVAQAAAMIRQYQEENQEALPLPFYRLLGTCCYEMQQYGRAAEAFGQALALDAGDADIVHSLAVCYYLDGRYQDAGIQFLRTQQLRPEAGSEFIYQAAVSFYQAQDFAQSRQTLAQLPLATLEPRSREIELFLNCLVELKDWPTAEKYLDDLLESIPAHAPYWRLLAQIHLHRQQYGPAATALEVLLRLQVASPEELANLAALYSYLNLPLRAAALLERVYGEEPDPQQVKEIATLYRRGFNYRAAFRVTEAALNRDLNEKPELKFLRAQMLYEQGRYRQLLDDYSPAAGNDAKISLLLGYAAWHLNAWKQAQSFFEIAQRDDHLREQARSAQAVLAYFLSGADQS
ncbi:MAG: tetratricopeptide repeat protein [Deltaproteobacteria bacterium]|nr:tetratricopeptide repeat protein [Deltaproteobacteria bacterium]